MVKVWHSTARGTMDTSKAKTMVLAISTQPVEDIFCIALLALLLWKGRMAAARAEVALRISKMAKTAVVLDEALANRADPARQPFAG